ncbi:MAG: NADH:ubiquinone oxidoreductase [Nanobdellota archaeon]
MPAKKPTIGVYTFSACSGCEIAILNLEDLLLELLSNFNIKYFHLLQGKNKEEPVDILLVEGAITTNKQKNKLLELRKMSETIVAIGSCACTGGIPAMKNDINRENISKLVYGNKPPVKSIKPMPIDNFINVDYYLNGCPINKEEFSKTIISLLSGKRPFQRPYPVCTECRIKENECLLNKGKICFGPIAEMGCGAECPSKGVPCTGCRGLCEEPELQSFISLLKSKKIKNKEIEKSFDNFLADRIDKKKIKKMLK